MRRHLRRDWRRCVLVRASSLRVRRRARRRAAASRRRAARRAAGPSASGRCAVRRGVIQPHGTESAGKPGQRHRNRVVVHQVHAVRIALRIEREGRRARRRARDEVARLQRPLEIARDQRARLLRAHVVRVVVAARERVRADQDAPLDFGTEARRARAARTSRCTSAPSTRKP